MISVVIPTLNAERSIGGTLTALVPAAAEGMVRDVIVADGGSLDDTEIIADATGCNWTMAGPSLSERLSAGAEAAKGPWLLFLLPGSEPEEGWVREVRTVVDRLERRGESQRRALVFSLGRDSFGIGARLSEILVHVRSVVIGLPLSEQGLLIHRSFYERLGGIRPLPAMGLPDLAGRVGRTRLIRLRSRLILSAGLELPEEGRGTMVRRALGFGLLALRVPPKVVARLFG